MSRTRKYKDSRPVAVASFAFLSRICTVLLQVLFTNLIPDHQADAFHLDSITDPSTSDKALHFLINGFSKWDASYFLHIAQHGYTRAEMFAFFPLYPFTVRLMADLVIQPLQHLLSLHMSLYSCVLISAVTLNVIFFCSAAVLLYYLGVEVLSCHKLAYKAALLFCINPASVFMTAAYTESLFALLSFAGMLALECREVLLSALLFSLSCTVRSNGIISVAFLLYCFMKRGTDLLTYFGKMIQRESKHKLSAAWNVIQNHCADILVTASLLPWCLVILLPFILFQVYSFMLICTSERDLVTVLAMYVCAQDVTVLADTAPSWCRHSRLLPYAAIQSQHWNVGFLRYYEVKQVPNFLLALPMVILCAGAVLNYCKKRWKYVCVLGLLETPEVQLEYKRTMSGNPWLGMYSNKSLVYMVQLASLVIFGVTCMHVQVVTRFIASSCPLVFWYAAHLTMDKNTESQRCSPGRQTKSHQHNDTKQNEYCSNASLLDLSKNDLIVQYMSWHEQSYSTRLVLAYFIGYCIIGTAMHCNFLPWT